MSDRMMTVAEARELIEIFKVGFLPDEDLPEVHRALETIVHQAEQIERLQDALRAADGLVLSFSGLPPRTDFEGDYNLLPGDMEAER